MSLGPFFVVHDFSFVYEFSLSFNYQFFIFSFLRFLFLITSDA
jgi:hypothetical protein